MVASSLIAPYFSANRVTKRILTRYFQAVDLEGVRIYKVRRNYVKVLVPLGITEKEFNKRLEGLDLAMQVPVLVRHDKGRMFTIQVADAPLADNIMYDEMMETGRLAVPLHTPFGTIFLDFEDEICAHLLIGGATRMGKTVLLRLITTHVLLRTHGKVKVFFLDNKITDLVMFRDIPQIEIGETKEDAIEMLDKVLMVVGERKDQIKASRSVDGRHLEPMFVIIDEYGRFADDNVIQQKVTEIAETAGYLNVHLIIATQRPDATSAIKPRIKANLLTRFAFTTADEMNSQVILGLPDAAHLDRIQGRAVFMDGFPHTVQVPYISADFAKEVLKPYVREGRSSSATVTPISSVVAEAFGGDDIPDIPQSTRNSKSRVKKARP
jgi:S-DNA-T family DNA segregation ATPase FtsK/SpoIIIE